MLSTTLKHCLPLFFNVAFILDSNFVQYVVSKHVDMPLSRPVWIFCSSKTYPSRVSVASRNTNIAHIFASNEVATSFIAPNRDQTVFAGRQSLTERRFRVEKNHFASVSFFVVALRAHIVGHLSP